MGAVSKWEIVGVPATFAFGAAHRLHLFESIGVTAEQLPDLMLLSFLVVAIVRGYFSSRTKPVAE